MTKRQETAQMEIGIISKEQIKPASPTPHFSEISILDQLTPHVYINPLVFFYRNDNSTTFDDDTTISETRQRRLRQSLGETLVTFYPLAGKIKDHLVIECNDAGVYYVEAQVRLQLRDFLRQPTNVDINRLLPFPPGSVELLSKTYLVMIQVSNFECGGIAIGLYVSHKIVDGLSVLTFMKAWAATARQSSQRDINYPIFVSASVFPPNPSLSKDLSLLVRQPTRAPVEEHGCVITRRFVFDRLALGALKNKAANSSFPYPSSATVVMGLLWKCGIEASNLIRRGFIKKRSVLSLVVNLRPRNSPPLPPHSFGNIFWLAHTDLCMEQSDNHLELQEILRKIRNAIAKINNDFVQGIKGENRTSKLMEHLKELKDACCDPDAEYFAMSSMCKGGLYEIDFGWGKPIWTCIGSAAGKDTHGLGNLVLLMDTRSGDGIEAWVTMTEEAMTIFEKNRELLAFASLDPSPLESNHSGIYTCL